MNSEIDVTRESGHPGRAPDAPVSMGRRRFARGVAPVLLGSVASTPALAGDTLPYHCTISGKLSGNTSVPRDATPCNELGKSPDYWKTQAWPSPLVNGILPTDSKGRAQCFNTDLVSRTAGGTRFNGYTAEGSTLARSFVCKGGVIYDEQQGFPGGSTAASMLQVINTGGELNDTALKALGRATVATLCNAYRFAPNFPLRPKQVVDMFNAVRLGGTYTVSPTVSMNRDQVRAYFQSLYDSAVSFDF